MPPYSIPGGSIGIAIYDNRVEIMNTGALPMGIDSKDLTSPHKSVPNNPLIANILYRRRMVESWGRGLELMYSECKRVKLPTPTLANKDGEVIVTFYFSDQATDQVKRIIAFMEDKEFSVKEILVGLI